VAIASQDEIKAPRRILILVSKGYQIAEKSYEKTHSPISKKRATYKFIRKKDRRLARLYPGYMVEKKNITNERKLINQKCRGGIQIISSRKVQHF
jgi:hypothetical protein